MGEKSLARLATIVADITNSTISNNLKNESNTPQLLHLRSCNVK